MNKYFYKGVPNYFLSSFCAVRDTLDNLKNVLNVAEIINTSFHCQTEDENDFDIVLFTGEFKRILIKKDDGYFSMAIPFQVITEGDQISFNSEFLEENVGGLFISIMRNCIQTVKEFSMSHEDIILSLAENFNLDVSDAMKYYDAFVNLIVEDHGYFRFDDDLKNQNGDIHPRYHFDIFYKNTTSIKIGYDRVPRLDCFYSLIDSGTPKKYLTAAK